MLSEFEETIDKRAILEMEKPAVERDPDNLFKRKRGRPPKFSNAMTNNEQMEMNFKTELGVAKEIFDSLIKLPKVDYFINKPDENVFGYKNYYIEIKNPMWLNEVDRKFRENEYTTLKEVLQDLWLIILNALTYWGPGHKLSKIVDKFSKVIEVKFRQLPVNFQKSCVPEEYFTPIIPTEDDFTETEPVIDYWTKFIQNESCKYDNIKTEDDEVMEINRTDTEDSYITKLESKLLDEFPLTHKEMVKWESEVLVTPTTKNDIRLLPQLMEIGQFLKFSHRFLDVRDITQYEIERMLLMPKESHTLATLMTSMLCSRPIRSHIFAYPTMTYEVWSQFLKKKVEYWYNVYYKEESTQSVFERCGIEPHFWAAMGDYNPFNDNEFCDLTFYQRVWIFKALCDYSFFAYKSIGDSMLLTEGDALRGTILGVDKNSCYIYYTVFWDEIRVYKQKKIVHSKDKHLMLDDDWFSTDDEHHKSVENTELKYEPPEWLRPSKKLFYLIAYNKRSLADLISSTKSNDELLVSLKELNVAEHDRVTLTGLQALYQQWNEARNRSENVALSSVIFWLSKPEKIEEVPPVVAALPPKEELPQLTDIVLHDAQVAAVESIKAENIGLPELDHTYDLSSSLLGNCFLENPRTDWNVGMTMCQSPGNVGRTKRLRPARTRRLYQDESESSSGSSQEPEELADVSDWEEDNKIRRSRPRKKRTDSFKKLRPLRKRKSIEVNDSQTETDIEVNSAIRSFSPINQVPVLPTIQYRHHCNSTCAPGGGISITKVDPHKFRRSIVNAALERAVENQSQAKEEKVREENEAGQVLVIEFKGPTEEIETSSPNYMSPFLQQGLSMPNASIFNNMATPERQYPQYTTLLPPPPLSLPPLDYDDPAFFLPQPTPKMAYFQGANSSAVEYILNTPTDMDEPLSLTEKDMILNDCFDN